MQELKLKIGAIVRVNIVPIHATLQAEKNLRGNYPDMPMTEYKSAAGHKERKQAPVDSPEWAEYEKKCREIRAEIEQAGNDFAYDYGVEAWQWPGQDWQTEPPDDWKLPAIFAKYGIEPRDRRIDYIKYELLRLDSDTNTVFNYITGSVAPITNAEVSAALDGFPTDKGR